MSETPISSLRQRMIEDMTVRKLGAATQRNYIRAVKTLSEFSAARRPVRRRKTCAGSRCTRVKQVRSRR
jgi:hypothetical protein